MLKCNSVKSSANAVYCSLMILKTFTIVRRLFQKLNKTVSYQNPINELQNYIYTWRIYHYI